VSEPCGEVDVRGIVGREPGGEDRAHDKENYEYRADDGQRITLDQARQRNGGCGDSVT
jgi:hypothetical protein